MREPEVQKWFDFQLSGLLRPALDYASVEQTLTFLLNSGRERNIDNTCRRTAPVVVVLL